MLTQGIGHPQIAFGIFEVDGIDFMGHRRRAHLTGYCFLAKITQGNITPEIPAEVGYDGVEARQNVKILGQIVMWLNLGGIGIPLQPQAIDKFTCKGRPVHLGIGHDMSVVIARSAVDLAQQRHLGQLHPLTAQTTCHIGHFLPQGRRGRRLTMGARHHGPGRMSMSQSLNGIHKLIHQGEQQLIARLPQHQPIGEVVDVFRGTGEMNKFGHGCQFLIADNFFLEEIFDGLDVMIGSPLNIFYSLGVR